MDQDIKKRIEDALDEVQGRELTPQEEREMQDGFALQEMTATAGWQVLKSWLQDMSYHSWVDPRGMKKEDWEFAELNAFHASNTATELTLGIEKLIERAMHLQGVKLGEVKNTRMRF